MGLTRLPAPISRPEEDLLLACGDNLRVFLQQPEEGGGARLGTAGQEEVRQASDEELPLGGRCVPTWVLVVGQESDIWLEYLRRRHTAMFNIHNIT